MSRHPAVLVLVAAVAVVPASAATIRVPADQPTIQAAINATATNDTVLVSPGVYTENVVINQHDLVLIGDTVAFSVSLHPAGFGMSPVTFGGSVTRSCQLVGFVIEGAQNVRGIDCIGASPTIRKNEIRNNASGGISFSYGGLGLVEENYIHNNTAGTGGGISMSAGAADVINNVIDSNRAGGSGGGIFCEGEAAHQVVGNVFRGNYSGASGGGLVMFTGGGSVYVSGNLFAYDTADHGGGLATGRYGTTVVNNTFDHCRCGISYGGGNAIWWGGTGGYLGEIKNNIFSNTSTGYPLGGAIGADVGVDGYVEISYNAFWQNSPADYYRLAPGPNSIEADPLYCDTIIGDYHLGPGSPCAAAGEAGVDIGAYGVGCSASGELWVTAISVGQHGLQHVTEEHPLIRWHYYDPGGQPQAAVEIEVGTDPDWTVAEMWLPGIFAGSLDTTTYAGSPLGIGQVYYIRIRVSNGTIWSDWAVRSFRTNSPPSAPSLSSPSDAGVVTTAPVLIVDPAVDPDGDPLTYAFEVYTDAALTSLVASVSGTYATWTVTPTLIEENGDYFWRARASDGYGYGPWSPSRSFWLNRYNDPPHPPAFGTPSGGVAVPDLNPQLDWEDAFDPDPGDVVTYTLTIASDSTFLFKTQYRGLTYSAFLVPVLSFGQRYWWKVKATDRAGLSDSSAIWSFLIPSPGDLDGDGSLTVVDVVSLINIVFRGAPLPEDPYLSDLTGDCIANISDVSLLIGHVFRGGPGPSQTCDQQHYGHTIHVPEDYAQIGLAVQAAAPGDAIVVAPGIYQENVVVNGKDVGLIGDTIGHSVVLRPTGPGITPLTLSGGVTRACQVVGFVIENAQNAAAISCAAASPTIRKNHIRDNTSAGILLTGGSLALILDNFIYRNRAASGAGVCMDGAAADLIGNVIDSNRASFSGGGVYCSGEGPHQITGNVFRNNYSAASGGGIVCYPSGGSVTISSNLFVNDTADHGGGVATGRAGMAIVNNTFDRCIAGLSSGAGNAIWCGAGMTGEITNNVFSNTQSLYPVGGAVGAEPGVNSSVTSNFNALWNNTPGDYYQLTPGGDLVFDDPLYCDPTSGDYRLTPGSPCLGAGQGGSDIGAFGLGCAVSR
ncbi:MAG: right-handed parallel beta-helix repeat-containing protein [Candidatus Zixiibacteriota bacterium]